MLEIEFSRLCEVQLRGVFLILPVRRLEGFLRFVLGLGRVVLRLGHGLHGFRLGLGRGLHHGPDGCGLFPLLVQSPAEQFAFAGQELDAVCVTFILSLKPDHLGGESPAAGVQVLNYPFIFFFAFNLEACAEGFVHTWHGS